MEVPTLDFASFLEGADWQRQQAATNQLLQALSHTGFVKIVNHGISESLVLEMIEWVRRFFALPPEVKAKAAEESGGPVPYRGWIRQGQENAAAISQFVDGRTPTTVHPVDIKEFFDLGSSVDPLYENLWVPETDLPGFRQFCESFYGKCFIIRAEMLRAIARGLKVELDLFERKCDTNVHSLRLLHYPACDIQTLKNGTKRVSEHSDTSVITLLFQDAVGGLEVEDRNSPGTFLPLAKAQGEEIILNVGDYMQRWTNGKLRSRVHRVVLPPSLMSSQDGRVEDRYSVVYFGKGNRETSAGPLEEFISEKNPAKYEDMTVMKYAQTKYKYLFAKQA